MHGRTHGPPAPRRSQGPSGRTGDCTAPSPPRRRRTRGGPLLALLLAAVVLTAGCLSYTASEVPAELLDGATGNGWQFHRNEPPDGPVERDFGLVKQWAKIYRDTGDRGGYPASLTVVSFKVAFSTPDRDEIKDRTQALVEEEAGELGVRLQGSPEEGTRTTAVGDEAVYFLYDGTAGEGSSLFDRQADIKVVGVVWNCAEAGGNTVVVVGLAQVNERSAGGLLQNPDDRNWRDIWVDATPGRGGGSDGGLAVHVTCG